MRLLLIFLVTLFVSSPGFGAESGHRDEHESHGEEREVHLKREMRDMIGLKTITVEKRRLIETVDVTGEIAQETENVVHITPQESGRLKKYLVRLGETVDPGDMLLVMTSKSGQDLEIPSESHGIVLAQYLKEGDPIDHLTSVMTISDPDLLRANFDVYERDIAKVKVGQEVQVATLAFKDRTFKGEIVFISPSVDQNTRTVKIRADVENKEHLLKFGMFVTGKIMVPSAAETLMVPEKSIQTIENETVVFVPSEDGDEFKAIEVELGRKAGDWIEVVSGLDEGDQIVSEGSFYLKSEALKGQFDSGHHH